MYVNLKPVGKERPRINKQTGHFYTPKKTRNFEDEIAVACHDWMKKTGQRITENAVILQTTCFVKVPKAWPKSKKAEALAGLIRPITTPDIDNVEKAVMDGMQGVFYVNDKQVVDSHTQRFYAEEAGLSIDAREI